MNSKLFLIAAGAVTAALCVITVRPVLAQAQAQAPTPGQTQTEDDPLPAGPGKDVVVRVCTSCHEASQFAFARHTQAEWDGEISKMVSAGAEMTAEEQTTISAYLAQNLNSGPPPAAATPTPGSTPAPGPTPSPAPAPSGDAKSPTGL